VPTLVCLRVQVSALPDLVGIRGALEVIVAAHEDVDVDLGYNRIAMMMRRMAQPSCEIDIASQMINCCNKFGMLLY
jgi:hypothetical protein